MRPIQKLLLISNYVNLFGFALFSPLYALFALDIGAGAFQTGIAYGLYVGLAGVLIIVLGKLEDGSKHKRKLVVFGYFWLAFASLLFLLVKSPVSLYVVQAINAIGQGILIPAWKATYSHYEDKGKEASEWSLFDGGNLIFTAIAAVIGGYLVKLYGFHIIFILMFAIQLSAAILSIWLIKIARKNSY